MVVAKIPMGHSHRRFEPRASDLETGPLPTHHQAILFYKTRHNLFNHQLIAIYRTLRSTSTKRIRIKNYSFKKKKTPKFKFSGDKNVRI